MTIIRPAENVRNEVSVIIGYSFKPSSDATVEIGANKFAMYTQNDGAWIKNAAEEARMIETMRKRGVSIRGIADRLNADGVPTAHGGARWHRSIVQKVLGAKRSR